MRRLVAYLRWLFGDLDGWKRDSPDWDRDASGKWQRRGRE